MNTHGAVVIPLDRDTPAAIEAQVLEGYRRMSPREKLERVRDLTRLAQTMALADNESE